MYIDDVLSEKHNICRVFGIHLSTWTWNEGKDGDCSLLLIYVLGLFSTLTMESLLLDFTTNGMISIFPLLTLTIPEQYYPFCTSIRRLRFTVNSLCQSMFKLSGLHGAWENAHYKVVEPGVSKTKLVATLKNFYGRHHDLVNAYKVQHCFWCFCQWRAQVDIRFYLHFFRSGLWAWWAKLAYQVMLTTRERLITPFILGFMSVGLNSLIRHSFTDLWFWITAWVPWPLLLYQFNLLRKQIRGS